MDDHQVFVIESAGLGVGAVYLGERDGDSWLELIEVTPSWQGRDIGTAALKWVEDAAAKSGQRVRLQVHRFNQRQAAISTRRIL